MNVFKLLTLLIDSEKTAISSMSNSSYIDYIAIFKYLRNSRNLCSIVLNQLEKTILPKTKEILDKEYDKINVTLDDQSYEIKINGEVKKTNNSETDYMTSGMEIRSFLKEEWPSENVVYTFELNEVGKSPEVVKNIEERYKQLKEDVIKDFLICELKENEMFKGYYEDGNQYFLKNDKGNFCIRFRQEKKVESFKNDLSLFFIANINKLNQIEFEEIKTKFEFNGEDKTEESWNAYIEYALKKLYPVDFFEHDFCKTETNDFFECLGILRKRDNFLTLIKSFNLQLDDETKKKFYNVLKYFCFGFLSEKEGTSKNFFCEKYPFSSKNTLSIFKNLEIEGWEKNDPSILVLQSFITYLLKKDLISDVKDSFLEVLRNTIYKNIMDQRRHLIKKISYIISYYNVAQSLKNYSSSSINKQKLDLVEIDKKMKDILSENDLINMNYYLSGEEKTFIVGFNY